MVRGRFLGVEQNVESGQRCHRLAVRFKGDAAAALALMQEEMKAHPDNASVMSLAARALEQLNRKPEALSMLAGALDLVEKQQSQQPGRSEPVPDLRRRYSALLKEMVAHPTPPPAKP